jgi:hypothetical protein
MFVAGRARDRGKGDEPPAASSGVRATATATFLADAPAPWAPLGEAA